jgi:hypothetical protein
MEISATRFTPDELKLISRALNTYTPNADRFNENEAMAEIADSRNLATRIYRENFRIGMENEVPKYREGHADFCNKDHAPGITPCKRVVRYST